MKQLVITLTIFLSFSTLAFSQIANSSSKKNFNLDKSNLALEGYDPVTYFTIQKATKGKENLNTTYAGITYRFSTVEDLTLFKANPTKYLPQYGGWCAYAMGSSGDKVDIDPETFKLVDGNLYLFYNKFFNNTKKTWNKDEKNLKKKADINWIKLNQQN